MLRGINGSGGGVPTSGSGTPGKLAKFTAGTTIGDSLLSESGTTITSAATAETFTNAQTWTLATSTTALDFGSGLLTLDTSNKILDSNGVYGLIGTRTAVAGRAGNWRYRDDTGAVRWLNGILGSAAATAWSLYDVVNSRYVMQATATGAIGFGGVTSPASNTLDVSTAAWGLKLPSSPGNADTQALDCYAEGTWTPALTGFGGTAPTVATARYTRIGRVVTLQVKLSATAAATFSSIASTTYISLPSGMTAAVEAPGSTSTSGIAADGPCVAYTNGNFYLPTFALRTSDTFLNVTYTV